MAVNTTLQILNSYINLLILQYQNASNQALISATSGMAIMPQTSVQTIAFSAAPTLGTFVLSYNGSNSSTTSYIATASQIQADLQANVPGLSSVLVTGSIASELLTITFEGVIPPANLLVVSSNSLTASSVPVVMTVTEIDLTLPLAVQQGFNIIPGQATAVGTQLDIIGKYVGVTRSGQGPISFVTLDDSDFLQLIYIAISQNSSGSSLSDIQAFLNRFFAGEIYVFDYSYNPALVMQMTYIISQAVGSLGLVQLVIAENLLPAPMGVGITTFFPPSTNLFTFSSAQQPVATLGHGFTTAQAYDTTGHWLTAQDELPG